MDSQCNEPYAENDVIPILPTSDIDIARLSLRIKTIKEKGLTHSLKKANGSKKRKKHAEKDANGTTANGVEAPRSKGTSSGEGKEKDTDKPSKAKAAPALSGINNASTASLTAKVLAEEQERNKRRKLEQNKNVQSLFSSRDTKPNAKNSSDYMTRGFSVPSKR